MKTSASTKFIGYSTIVVFLAVLTQPLDAFPVNGLMLVVNPLHPLIIHFPVVLITLAFIFAMLKSSASYITDYGFRCLLYGSAIACVFSVISGYATAVSESVSGSYLRAHQYSATFLAIYTIILAIHNNRLEQLRSSKVRILIFSLWLVLVCVVGYLGGTLTHGTSHFNFTARQKVDFDSLQNLLVAIPAAQRETFHKDVLPVFEMACTECHGSTKRKGGLRLDSLEHLLAGGSSGPVIEAKAGEGIELINRINLGPDHPDFMPKDAEKLSEEQIEVLTDWTHSIKNLGPLNRLAFHREQIADRSLAEVKINSKGKGLKHPIDVLVDNYFEQHDISWPSRAKDQILVRRFYLDLVGRVPNKSDMLEGLELIRSDQSNRLIEKLLGMREEYVLHWLSFWNDLFRNDYAGTGFLSNGREQVTSWLVKSVYENRSYKDMAIDLVTKKRGAEGFLRGLSWIGDQQPHQQSPVQAAQNVSSALLGLDMRCASCHDSFTSGWRLKDVYQFAQIFAKEELSLHKCGQNLNQAVTPQFLFPNISPAINSNKVGVRLEQLGKALTNEKNGNFSRNIVNRIWKKLVGRGLIEPTYNISKKPWSPKLLDWLASDFIDHQYDLKHLIKRIVSSRTYQLARRIVRPSSTENFVFSGPMALRMTAEQFLDSIFYISNSYPSLEDDYLRKDGDGIGGQFGVLKEVFGTKHSPSFARSSIMFASPLLRALGRPDRDQSFLERDATLAPWLIVQLLSNHELDAYIRTLAITLDEDLKLRPSSVFKAFRLVLNREPSAIESKSINSQVDTLSIDLKDLLWTLFMHPEYLIIR